MMKKLSLIVLISILLAVLGCTDNSNRTETESWNGYVWTEVNDLNTARRGLGAAGVSNTSALAFGGLGPAPGRVTVTESWDGSSFIVKLRRGSGKDRQGMAPKAKGLKA